VTYKEITKRVCSEHSLDEIVDEDLSVAPITTLVEGVSLVVETTSGGIELEGPEEVVGFLEVRSDGDEFVDEILNAVDSLSAESLLDDGVVGKRDSLSVNLSETSLEDELLDGLSSGVSKSDEGEDLLEHVKGSLVDSEEGTVVELSESEQSQDSLDFRVELVNTNWFNKSIINMCKSWIFLKNNPNDSMNWTPFFPKEETKGIFLLRFLENFIDKNCSQRIN
jgi:hypothetical protein